MHSQFIEKSMIVAIKDINSHKIYLSALKSLLIWCMHTVLLFTTYYNLIH